MNILYLGPMQENVNQNFIPLHSKNNLVITWLINILASTTLIGMFILLALLPIFIFSHTWVLIIIALAYYPILAIVAYRFFKYIKSKIAVTIKAINIDKQGVHFYKKDNSITHILYSQLEQSYLSDQYDVYLKQVNKTYHLAVRANGIETRVVFDGTDYGSMYYITNARALRARFIEGIVRFRPDLKVDPFIFKEFCIDPNQFTFDRKRYIKHIVKAALIIGLIILFSTLLAWLITLA
ncbi:hypothetical protein HX017_16170 [Myroides marinus]|uniref:Uncharacterized protein n=2 Tax=Myroides marinus TaxID=703342 RepID=A0A163ZQY0_9FLAO|nr:hypothetical protein AV926_07215 [Myroides marinus]MDM1352005.1 hypothetical protein [Myroides marinus]MDM1359228.1 hypothetical protein [Myroides marinus]MDM1366473.1 hypothetical protein [Myroides marinus]